MVPFAHFGHWAVSLIYAAPALLLAGALAWSTIRQRRRDAARRAAGGGGSAQATGGRRADAGSREGR